MMTEVAALPSQTTLDSLQLPSNFNISLYYAGAVPNARSLAVSTNTSNGVIVFVSTKEAGAVYALVDRNKDGVADNKVTLLSGLDTPNGLAYWRGSLYVSGFDAAAGYIARYDGADNAALLGKPLSSPTVVTRDLPLDRAHGWRYMKFGPDGRLYVTIGAPCNICVLPPPYGGVYTYASVMALQLDASGSRVLQVSTYASGIRNSVGMDWHPDSRVLYFTNNGRDQIGDDTPDDTLLAAPRANLSSGYPYCHQQGLGDPYKRLPGPGVAINDPNVNGDGSVVNCSAPSAFTRAVQALGPHVAALGMTFYQRNKKAPYAFPADYDRAVFIAEHGSWNRKAKIGYRLSVVKLRGGVKKGIVGKATSLANFADGWSNNVTNSAWGRPVDVAQLPDGSLLLSDDYAGVVYRITYKAPGIFGEVPMQESRLLG